MATDASAEQLTLAPRHSRVEYKVARSESAGLEDHSAALITVAVAVHWFDFDQFYAEVRRTLSPEGLIAVWCYSLPAIEPVIDRILDRYLRETLADYWPERFRYIYEQYRTLPFPFEEVKTPKFSMETYWDLSQVLGFLHSWSGTANYEKQMGHNPIHIIRPLLTEAWGDEPRKRNLNWNLFLRVGKML